MTKAQRKQLTRIYNTLIFMSTKREDTLFNGRLPSRYSATAQEDTTLIVSEE